MNQKNSDQETTVNEKQESENIEKPRRRKRPFLLTFLDDVEFPPEPIIETSDDTDSILKKPEEREISLRQQEKIYLSHYFKSKRIAENYGLKLCLALLSIYLFFIFPYVWLFSINEYFFRLRARSLANPKYFQYFESLGRGMDVSNLDAPPPPPSIAVDIILYFSIVCPVTWLIYRMKCKSFLKYQESRLYSIQQELAKIRKETTVNEEQESDIIGKPRRRKGYFLLTFLDDVEFPPEPIIETSDNITSILKKPEERGISLKTQEKIYLSHYFKSKTITENYGLKLFFSLVSIIASIIMVLIMVFFLNMNMLYLYRNNAYRYGAYTEIYDNFLRLLLFIIILVSLIFFVVALITYRIKCQSFLRYQKTRLDSIKQELAKISKERVK